jgi:hypothetical protein
MTYPTSKIDMFVQARALLTDDGLQIDASAVAELPPWRHIPILN